MAPDFSSIKPAPSNRPRQQQHRRDILGEDGRDQRMEGSVRQTASWFKYGLVILLVVTILGIILAGLSGGSSESDTVRTGHGPNSITKVFRMATTTPRPEHRPLPPTSCRQ